MHDTLNYISKNPIYRRHHHGDIVFGLHYAFFENFVLPLSHDEVVHGKGSILGRMPGDRWQRFANLRAYYTFMFTHPGKKMLFMGCEFGQEREWDHDSSLDWHLLQQADHAGIQKLVRDLNRLYRETPALHQLDCEAAGFTWLIADDTDRSVFAWLRNGSEPGMRCLAVLNFTPEVRRGYRIKVPSGGPWREIFNSDSEIYGGTNVGNAGVVVAAPTDTGGELSLTLPPLAGVIFVPEV
jgi:1,4-alpha-glucan branching enzyme